MTTVKQEHSCPVCGITARGYDEIKEIFGWTRDAGARKDKPISYCKEDRREHGAKRRLVARYRRNYPSDTAKRSVKFMTDKLEGKKNRERKERTGGRFR